MAPPTAEETPEAIEDAMELTTPWEEEAPVDAAAAEELDIIIELDIIMDDMESCIYRAS